MGVSRCVGGCISLLLHGKKIELMGWYNRVKLANDVTYKRSVSGFIE